MVPGCDADVSAPARVCGCVCSGVPKCRVLVARLLAASCPAYVASTPCAPTASRYAFPSCNLTHCPPLYATYTILQLPLSHRHTPTTPPLTPILSLFLAAARA